ncbi:MAG: site-specific integrase [Pseudonocardia sp.]|nr:site-specific integrase [Pseudonocardia sp.]
MVDTLDRSKPIGLRDHALLLLGIVSFGRRSEVVSYTWEDVSKVPEGLVLRLRKSKTDQDARGATIPVLYGAFPGTDPVRVLARWRELCERRGITSGPILRSVDRHGRIGGSLSPQAVNVAVQRIAERAGLGSGYTAHSLRAGAATIAYKNGAPISKICELGRWKQGSPVVLRYIRAVDQWTDHPFQGVL